MSRYRALSRVETRRTVWLILVALMVLGVTAMSSAREGNRRLAPGDPDRATLDRLVGHRLQHPYLFFQGADIPRLCERLKTAPYAAMGRAIPKTADAMLDDPINPEPDPGPVPSSRPEGGYDTVYLDVHYDFFGFGYHLFDFGPHLAMAWVLTGDPKYAARCRDWLMAYAAQERLSVMAALADNQSSHAIEGMAIAYDWIYDYLDDHERRTILNALQREGHRFAARCRPMADQPLAGHKGNLGNNHTWVTASGFAIAALATLYDLPEAPDWLDQQFFIFRDRLIPASFGLEGEYVDGAGGWLHYSLENGFMFFTALHAMGGPDLFVSPRVRNTGRYVARANGMLAPDWKGIDPMWRSDMLCLARQTRDPFYQYLALSGTLGKVNDQEGNVPGLGKTRGNGEHYYRWDFNETKYEAGQWQTVAIEWDTRRGLCKTWIDAKPKDKCPLVDEVFAAADGLALTMEGKGLNHFDVDAIEI